VNGYGVVGVVGRGVDVDAGSLHKLMAMAMTMTFFFVYGKLKSFDLTLFPFNSSTSFFCFSRMKSI